MSIVSVPFCYRCGVPHVPEELAERVQAGESISIDVVYTGSGVAANVARHGTGALNIDGCRIGTDDDVHMPGPNGGRGGAAWREAEGRADRMPVSYQPSTLGRWPANVVLGHHEDCREVGVKRVKGNRAPTPSETRPGGKTEYRMAADYEPVGYTDPDGYETVSAWECHPDCAVALLDAQSGISKDRPHARKRGDTNVYQQRANSFRGGWDDNPYYGDTGGASRFFKTVNADDPEYYTCEDCGITRHISELSSGCPSCGETMVPARFMYCAKASRAERNAGLAGMPERAAHLLDEAAISTASNRRCAVCGLVKFGNPHCICAEPQWQETAGSKNGNHHPTVKPIALMRWLVRLVTPPGGTVLDPFMGSGTTGIACVLEGLRFVGIEQDAEYIEIARRRIAHAEKHGENWIKASKAGPRTSGVYAGGKGRKSVSRCVLHGAPRPHGRTAGTYRCGCPVQYVDPNEVGKALNYGPLFAALEDS